MAGDIEENHRLLSALELPECEGPKLKAFPYRNPRITWMKWMNPTNDESQSQGYVFKVKIMSNIYALKVFKFYKPSLKHACGLVPRGAVTDVELKLHTDPFYAECRAYAQIEARRKSQALQRKDIADCYGFLTLKKADEELLSKYGIDLWCDIPLDDEYRKRAEGTPARALVKEYIEEDEDVDMSEETLGRIATTIKWMNRNDILIHDIHPRNFKAGYLLDLGTSWTKPHCLWQHIPKQIAVTTVDVIRFEEMADELGFGKRRSLRSRTSSSETV